MVRETVVAITSRQTKERPARLRGVGALSGWDSPRARSAGDGATLGVTKVVSHAAVPEGDALAWYSPLGAGAAPAFSYTGKPYDAATGLYYFPYRQYDPSAARWLTRDPLGMVDGPNVYAYVTGNPVGRFDKEGTLSLPVIGGIIVVVVTVVTLIICGVIIKNQGDEAIEDIFNPEHENNDYSDHPEQCESDRREKQKEAIQDVGELGPICISTPPTPGRL